LHGHLLLCNVHQQPVEEVLSQLAYKDARIIDLDSEIQRLHETIIDLRENISEKNEVISSRDRALQIMQDMQAAAEAERRDEHRGLSQPDSTDVVQLQKQLAETGEQLAAREKSTELLTEELNTRNQYIADLTSYLTNYQNSYAALQESCAALEIARNAVVTNCGELETRIASVETSYNELLAKQLGLDEHSATLEQYCASVQASHTELNQSYVALDESYSTLQQKHTTLETSFMQLQVSAFVIDDYW